MNWEDINWMLALPEIFLLVALLVIMILDLFIPDAKKNITYGLTLLALLSAALIQLATFPTHAHHTFSHMYVTDPLAALIKIAMDIVTLVVLVYGRQYVQDQGIARSEWCLLTLFALLGMQVMVSASHFLTLYIGLELLSLALYALVALQRDSVSASEAAMKYFVLGALASGLLLYGISMVYGATGSLEIKAVADAIQQQNVNPWLLTFSLVFLVAGLCFKLGATPFHMWVPDVYHGAPTAVALTIGAAPKLAVLVFIMRILVQGLEALAGYWQSMLLIVAVLSMAIGSITALVQTNIKRIFAYSTIAHMGFLFLGMVAGNAEGYSAALFYALVYVLMTTVGFGIVLLLSRKGFECEKLEDLSGLNQRNSWYALLMLLAMVSMAGLPPLAGFYAKLLVISAVLRIDLVPLGVFAVLMSLVGAFYYLRIVKVIYFDDVQDHSELIVSADVKIILSLNAAALLLLGIWPQRLLSVCVDVMKQSLALS